MFNSIRTKLTLWYLAILALVIVAFAVSTYVLIVRTLDKNMNMRLAELAENFTVAVNSEQTDEEEKPTPEQTISEAMNEFNFQDFKFSVYSNDGKLIASTVENKSNIANPHHFRTFSQPLKVANDQFQLFVYGNLHEQNELKNLLSEIFLFAVPLTIFLAGLGGYFLARKSLQPIVEMGNRAKQISSQNLHERLPIANKYDEVGNLATVFNDLLNRLDTAFERQKQFMADASHELRTPLAIVRGESEVALSKTTRTNAEYQESLAIVHDESRRLTNIVEDLFTLARADSGQFTAKFSEVYLDEIVADCVRSIRTLAEKRNIKIELSSEETLIKGNEKLLHRLFLNLLDNAVKYNYENGKIFVIVEKQQVTIKNTGEKIPEDERTKIFERFYRADKARSRQSETATSGAGLGLSIANWIAELHHAELKLVESNETATVFSVNFSR
jgi:two-component system, OmpR family, sensor kinase